MRRKALAAVTGLLIAVVGALWLFPVGAGSAVVSITMPANRLVGQSAEVRVHVSWVQARSTNTLVRIDGVKGWRPSRFGPDGYESRAFCDDDNPVQPILRTRQSIGWLTGNLWPGASCDLRLFLVPEKIGKYRVRIHFITGTPQYLIKHAATARGTEETFRVMVTR